MITWGLPYKLAIYYKFCNYIFQTDRKGLEIKIMLSNVGNISTNSLKILGWTN